MITLSIAQVKDPNFNEAMNKLIQAPIDPTVGYKIKRIADKISSEQRQHELNYRILLEKFKKEEKVTVEEDGKWNVKDEFKDEWAKDVTDLFTKTFTIDRWEPLTIGDLKTMGATVLSTVDLAALEPVMAQEESQGQDDKAFEKDDEAQTSP